MKTSMGLRSLLAADLFRATGRSGVRGLLAAAVFEPGFGTVLLHRICARVYQAGLQRTAKLLWRLSVMVSGCHIHLASSIGPGLKLPHPAGVVIGEGCTLGASVTVYQHVTIGRSMATDAYPSVEDGVTLFPGAVVVGAITVGAGAVVGANSVVRHDVPPGAVVAGNPASVLVHKGEMQKPGKVDALPELAGQQRGGP